MKLTVSFFDRGPFCPTDRARDLFSASFFLILFFLFFYFLLVLFSLVPDCTTSQRKVSPAVKYPLFRCSVYLFGVATTVCFPVLPLHPPTPEKWSRLRWFFVYDHLITKMPTFEKPFQRPSTARLAEVLMITFSNMDDLHKFSNDFFRSPVPTLSGPKQGLSVDSFFLISFSC